MDIEYRKYALFLCSVPYIGGRTVEKLMEHFGDVRSIYEGDKRELEGVLSEGRLKNFLETRDKWDVDIKYMELEQKGINFVTVDEAGYPMRLKNIPDAPYGIFYIGSMPKDEDLSVAVIGARDCSEYGRYVASELGRKLGEAGIQVVSGMARGIDGISQIEAVNAGGASYAVLGSGVDVCYPEQNRHIYERLKECGGIISTYPAGMAALPGNFPPRNRIVSGLADAVVVIEARVKSGTLITVDMALEQGKDVYVVPGRVTDRLSDGCNRLIGQGAEVFLSPDIFVDEMLKRHEMRRPKINLNGEGIDNKPELSKELKEVAEALDFTPQDIEKICRKLKSKRTVSEMSALLMQLTLMGIAAQVSSGQFVLKNFNYKSVID